MIPMFAHGADLATVLLFLFVCAPAAFVGPGGLIGVVFCSRSDDPKTLRLIPWFVVLIVAAIVFVICAPAIVRRIDPS